MVWVVQASKVNYMVTYFDFKRFENLIGHEITISGYGTLARCENPCYVETEQNVIGMVNGIPIVETHLKSVVNLPEPEVGVYYIVSRITMNHVPKERQDVFCVDTGPSAVRDENGQVIAVTQLSI